MTQRRTTTETIDGVLPVDKPAGPTSHDIVARVRRALGTRRIGHTGTLDPFASGLLLLCIGRATRIAEYLTGMDKRYEAVVRLGTTTDTDDSTGAVINQTDPGSVICEDVERALGSLRGDIDQLPPAYSAKKVGGERAYALARLGNPPVLEPVRVHIAELTVTRCDLPSIEIDVRCSSGTYIRAIARDLGALLGVGGHLTALRRTAVGPHRVDDATTLTALEADPTVARPYMISTLDALGDMPRVELAETDIPHIAHGRPIATDGTVTGLVALARAGELVAIAEADAQYYRPRKVFL